MMKKLYKTVLAITLVLLMGIINVSAQNSNVTFLNEAEEFVVYPVTKDLFQNFKDVMPGSKYRQVIEIANDKDNEVGVDMYLKMDPVTEENRELLKFLTLTIEIKDEVIYKKTLDENEGFKDFVLLASLDPGDMEKLDLTLEVPFELENKFADKMGFVDWVFLVEDYDVKGTDVPPTKPVVKKPIVTGIQNSVMPYVIIASGVGVLLLAGLKKQKDK